MNNTSKTLYRQCNLRSGQSQMTCWLDERVRVGWRVTLSDSEDPTIWWTIESVGDTLLPRKEIKGAHASKNWHKNDFHGVLKGLIAKNV